MNEQRTKVFLDRYALRDTSGNQIETNPEEMWLRVANAIGDTDDERHQFHRLLDDFKFVPGGRILSGAGTGTEVTFYNCYVIPVETKARRHNRNQQAYFQPDPGSDSREAILDTISVMVDIMSRGGGVGINWSVLRPRGAHLKRVNGTTSGPVSWMDVASRAVGVVEQGGSRRGAAMFMLDDWHPDVEDFINAKRDFSLITNANVSVAVSDEFMEAVRSDGDWTLRFPDTSDPRYNADWDGDLGKWEASGGQVVTYRTVRARDLWRGFADAAWNSGEPGVVFLGRYNALSTAGDAERIICVNPCGEQGLGAYSVCNLGAMNLDAYIRPVKKTGKYSTPEFTFDWDNFGLDVEIAVRFLDNVIDKNFYFIPENEQAQKNLRRIGLGVMGLADALIALKLRYGSPEAVAFTEKVFEKMKTYAVRSSANLALEKGPAPAWKQDMADRPFLRGISGTPLGRQIKKYGLRNLFLLTQAPTGSTSILAGVNGGIEPYFDLQYVRKDRTGEHIVVASAVEKYTQEGIARPDYLVTANDVTIAEHIAMQAAAQKYIDSSVSKTINGPTNHTLYDVEEAYSLAYDSGLKGLAYYRDGSRDKQVLNRTTAPTVEIDPETGATYKYLYDDAQNTINELRDILDANYSLFEYAQEYSRPAVLEGTTVKAGTRAGSAYITVNRDPDSGRAVEVFFNVGKAGSDVASMAEAMGRLASLALRKGATLGGVANQLEGVGGQAQFNKPIPHAIGEALTVANKPKESKKVTITMSDVTGTYEAQADSVKFTPVSTNPTFSIAPKADLCPECGSASFIREEGCAKCLTCGHSVC